MNVAVCVVSKWSEWSEWSCLCLSVSVCLSGAESQPWVRRDLRAGEFDVLIGINLLREGLDLPEVALVAILDADKEGFLRSTRSLIQTIGRASRNVDGRVILYADKQTNTINATVSETSRRREIQQQYNEEHGITPTSIVKRISTLRDSIWDRDYVTVPAPKKSDDSLIPSHELPELIDALRREMRQAAQDLEYERAAELRDRIRELEAERLRVS